METLTLSIFVLGMGTHTSGFQIQNFKPLLVATDLNKYFGLFDKKISIPDKKDPKENPRMSLLPEKELSNEGSMFLDKDSTTGRKTPSLAAPFSLTAQKERNPFQMGVGFTPKGFKHVPSTNSVGGKTDLNTIPKINHTSLSSSPPLGPQGNTSQRSKALPPMENLENLSHDKDEKGKPSEDGHKLGLSTSSESNKATTTVSPNPQREKARPTREPMSNITLGDERENVMEGGEQQQPRTLTTASTPKSFTQQAPKKSVQPGLVSTKKESPEILTLISNREKEEWEARKRDRNASKAVFESETSTGPLELINKRYETLKNRVGKLEEKLATFGLSMRDVDFVLPGDVPRTYIPTTFLQLTTDIGKMMKVVNQSRIKYTDKENIRFTDRNYVASIASEDVQFSVGMAFSRIHSNTLYVINGREENLDDTYLYVFNPTTGRLINKIKLKGSSAVMWADMAVAPCSAGSIQSCIYIGDLDERDDDNYDNDYGDNDKPDNPANVIYIYEEPKNVVKIKAMPVRKKVKFNQYGSCSKSLMVTPQADIYMVTREEDGEGEHLYLIKDGRAEEQCITWFDSEWKGPMSTAISNSGTFVLVMMMDMIYIFYVPDGNYREVFCNDKLQIRLNYTVSEAEAIAFTPDELSFYTLAKGTYSPLWRYDRIKVSGKG